MIALPFPPSASAAESWLRREALAEWIERNEQSAGNDNRRGAINE